MVLRLLLLLSLALGAASAAEAAECTTVRKGPNDYVISCPGGASMPPLPADNPPGGLHGEVFVSRGFGPAPAAGQAGSAYGGQGFAAPLPGWPGSIPPSDRLTEPSPAEAFGQPLFPMD